MKTNYNVQKIDHTLILRRRIVLAASVCMVLAFGMSVVEAAPVFSQGFETDTDGWLDSSDFAGYGDIVRVGSGTGGIASFEGSFHAVVTQSGPLGDESAPFTRFDGYRDTWPGTMTASAAIYLDTSWSAGEGFDYSVAANGSDNNHRRDFIFHVTSDTSSGSLLVGGSNNTNFDPPRGPRYTFELLYRFDVRLVHLRACLQ
jgi:hypothetical protein